MKYSDLDMMLRRHVGGDLRMDTGIEAVKNSLRNIVMTMQGSRRMLPEFAGAVHELLFEPIDRQTAHVIGNELLKAINQWDDRVIVENVNVFPNEDENRYDVTLRFRIRENPSVQERLDVVLFQR
jgi:uncharacterized protein